MIENTNSINLKRKTNFSHALTTFSIAATVACLFAPVFEIGMAHNLESESKVLDDKKQSLLEEKNLLLSQVSSLQTPESIYDIAVENNYQLNLIQSQL
jgi:cell division protein FtsL